MRADGSEGDYFYVDMAGAVGIVPLFEDGTVVLCRQYRYLLGVWLWEFPIGGLAPGDDPEAKAREELREEAGLEADRFVRLGSFAPYKGVSNEVTHFFLAEGLREVGQRLEASEAIEVHRLPLGEARRRLLDQPLGDGQSWGGLLLLERHLESRGR